MVGGPTLVGLGRFGVHGGRVWRTALHLESRLENRRTKYCKKCGCAIEEEDLPHGSRAPRLDVVVWRSPDWMYGVCRRRWLSAVPRPLSPNCVHTRAPCRPVTRTSYSRDEAERNLQISGRRKFFLICLDSRSKGLI